MPAPPFRDEILAFYYRNGIPDLAQRKHLARWWHDDRRDAIWIKIRSSKLSDDLQKSFIECALAARSFANAASKIRLHDTPQTRESGLGAAAQGVRDVLRATRGPRLDRKGSMAGVIFMRTMRGYFRHWTGKLVDDVVGILTDIAFDRSSGATTLDEVRGASRNWSTRPTNRP